MNNRPAHYFPYGLSTFDVCTWRGKGESQQSRRTGDVVREVTWVLCGQGMRGSKKYEMFWTSYVDGPLPK